jgi:hypothetical protein
MGEPGCCRLLTCPKTFSWIELELLLEAHGSAPPRRPSRLGVALLPELPALLWQRLRPGGRDPPGSASDVGGTGMFVLMQMPGLHRAAAARTKPVIHFCEPPLSITCVRADASRRAALCPRL